MLANARDERERSQEHDQLILDKVVHQRLVAMTANFNKLGTIQTLKAGNARDRWLLIATEK
ncbi:hypothetical protein [Agrobacterium sp. MCAB5]|uniref:hypothetical protein n=1 Tax=Agrobacterium sp. MCAB5 TaxID=3233042 RepID=UPI003F8E04CE